MASPRTRAIATSILADKIPPAEPESREAIRVAFGFRLFLSRTVLGKGRSQRAGDATDAA
jgi:hypothetical protein